MFFIFTCYCVFYFYDNYRIENVHDCKFKKYSIRKNCFDNYYNVVVDKYLFVSINRTFSKFQNFEIKNIYFDIEKFQKKIQIKLNNNKN